MKMLLAVLLLLASLRDGHADELTTHDIAWETVYQSLLVVDWAQTLELSRLCQSRIRGVQEVNPILGPCPTPGRVNAWFIGASIGHVVALNLLPRSGRRPLQMLTIGIQLSSVSANFSLGLGF